MWPWCFETCPAVPRPCVNWCFWTILEGQVEERDARWLLLPADPSTPPSVAGAGCQATALNHHHDTTGQRLAGSGLASTKAPAPEPCDDTSARRSGSRSPSNNQPTSDTPYPAHSTALPAAARQICPLSRPRFTAPPPSSSSPLAAPRFPLPRPPADRPSPKTHPNDGAGGQPHPRGLCAPA